MWAGVQDTHEAHGPPSFRFLMASAWFMQAGTTMLLWSGHKSHHIPSAGGEGNGNPLHYSCLENPMDRGAWRAILQEVAKGQTQLKWLSVHPPRAGVANHTLSPHPVSWKTASLSYRFLGVCNQPGNITQEADPSSQGSSCFLYIGS